MARDSILIVGGTGEVGARLARQLEAQHPGEVVIGSRDPARVKGFPARQIDVDDPKSIDAALGGISTVVACVSQHEPHLLCAAVHHGLAYTSIAPPWIPWDETEPLRAEAKRTGARVVLAAGLEPGISSVLAASCAHQLEAVDSVETALLLSLGDHFGADSMAFIFGEVEQPYTLMIDDTWREVMAFETSKRVHFPEPVGERRAWNMGFRDQLYYPWTLGTKTAVSRLALDPPWLSTGIADLLKLGLRRWMRGGSRERVRKVIEGLRRRYAGHDQFALVVEVTGAGSSARATLRGRGQAEATAAGAGAITEALFTREMNSPGVWLAEQVIDPGGFLQRLEAQGLWPAIEPPRQLAQAGAAQHAF